ncbi:MAG: YceI family protein [Bacteroidota bacterium]
MKNYRNLLLPLLLISTVFIGLNGFVGYEKGETAPGTIQAIGNAGSDQVFTFRKWNFVKAMVPNDDFEAVEIEVAINTSSLQTSWKDLEKSVKKKKDYFYVKKFPQATISIKGAQKQADGSFTTEAALTLKGITKTVPLSFRVSDEKPYRVTGEGVIKRRKFGFSGGGPKNEVPISFDVVLPQN